MRIPEKTVCTFCQQEIQEGVPFATLQVPLPPSIRKTMIDDFEQVLTPRYAASPLGGLFTAESQVPHKWVLEACAGCVFGLFPGVRDAIAKEVQDRIQRSVEARERHERAQRELDEVGA